MPRVITKTKSRAGKSYSCQTCGRTIEPGEKYFSWSFRYGRIQALRNVAGRTPEEAEAFLAKADELEGRTT